MQGLIGLPQPGRLSRRKSGYRRVLQAEAIKIREQPSAVGLVGLLGVSQLSNGLHESLLLVDVEGAILVHVFDQAREAAAQVGKRLLEGHELCRDGCALSADGTEVVPYQCQEAVLLPPVEPDDGREVLHVLWGEVIDLTCDLAIDLTRVKH